MKASVPQCTRVIPQKVTANVRNKTEISVSVFSFKSERNVPIIFSSHLPYSQKIQQTPIISESVQETWTMSTEKNFKSYAVTDFLPFSYQLPPTIFQAQVIINKITKIISM